MQPLSTPPLDDLPLPPPAGLTLSERQVEVVRLALENLLWTIQREDHLTPEIQALLTLLPSRVPPASVGRGAHASVAPPPSTSRPLAERHPSAGAAETPGTIRESYAVYAHHVDARNRTDLGQYVGVVHTMIDREGVRYIHVRGGLQHANELFIPMTAVRMVVGKQVHLGLSREELAGRAWHLPPSGPA
ncbi:MAG TPA: hypothetical protein VK066_20430 [Chloroflexota bacterium]|nr:hypothetical protein [Chloroflexota bacterium]